MNPAMAIAVQTADEPRIKWRAVDPSSVISGLVKLLILSVAASHSAGVAEMPEGLIREVAQSGSRRVAERDHYTYTQTFKFWEINKGVPTGRYEEVRDITFTGTGERAEHHRKRPILQLRRLRLTDEDFRDLRDVNPFVLTSETLRFYKVGYKGIERVGDRDCYVLRLRPRQILYEQRFFDGLAWVDVEHRQVVRAAGRPVPQIHRMEDSNLFPGFETRYEPVDGKHWFPVRTAGDDILPFPAGHQRVRLLIEYSDYKRFTATSTVTFSDPAETPVGSQAPK